MRNSLPAILSPVAACSLVSCVAEGGVAFLAQERTIKVAVTSSGEVREASAPNFLPFVRTLSAASTFTGVAGEPVANEGVAGIDCQVDPDAVRAIGSLAGSGGISILGTPEFGEAKADLRILFEVDEPTPFRLRASPRPITVVGDDFEVELENDATSAVLFRIDGTDEPQEVYFTGELLPGVYSLRYEMELSVSGPQQDAEFFFEFDLTPACHGACAADCDNGSGFGVPDDAVTIDDLLYFLVLFEQGLSCADLDNGGGAGVTDGGVTIDDLLYFLERFSEGC